jgi:hypothetical protein
MDDGDGFSTENAMEVPEEKVYFCKCTETCTKLLQGSNQQIF